MKKKRKMKSYNSYNLADVPNGPDKGSPNPDCVSVIWYGLASVNLNTEDRTKTNLGAA